MSGLSPVFLAKSSGVTLEEHTQHLRDQLEEHILPSHAFAGGPEGKYARMTGGEDLHRLTRQAIKWHDVGKKHDKWQAACRADHLVWKAWHDSGRVGWEPRGEELRMAGMRHEMDSLRRMLLNEPDISEVVRVAVAAHHSKLSWQHEKRWHDDPAFVPLWKALNVLGDCYDLDAWREAVKKRYRFDGPRALLQLADHRASAEEDNRPLAFFTKFHYDFRHGERRGPQKIIDQLWDEPVALLRAATGSGKTDAAFLWARHQIEKGRADRLVVAMPTRFTANALAVSNTENLSEIGLYHSTAWYQYEAESKMQAELDMARLLETPITVTTIDHLCISLTATREDHHSVFFNLAHSCVVIDEADFYDAFTQANLAILLNTLRELQVPMLLMSATLPESCKEIYSVPRIYKDVTDYDRPRCDIKSANRIAEKPSDIADLLQPAIDGCPTIIYANTVQRAQRYYRYLRRKLPHGNVVLYHSRYTEPDKAKIEKKLSKMLGKDAWKKGTQTGVAILTQIGELSVNISADYMISDLCPLDRLVQRAGRLSRFPESNSPGEMHIILPHKKNKNGVLESYPAPYGTYHNDWQPHSALSQTQEIVREPRTYSARDFVVLVNTLYPQVLEMEISARENQRMLKELIAANWLVRQSNQIAKDADRANEWKSRDIDFQYTLLVSGKPANIISDDEFTPLKSWREWRNLQLTYGVNCYAYEFHAAVADGCLEKITFSIGESGGKATEDAWFVKSGYYDSDEGLCLRDPEDEDEED